MAELTKPRTAEAFQKLVDFSFYLNSIFDNIVYGLEKELRMPLFASFVHHTLSHSFPLDFADSIQEFALSRGVRITRGIVSPNTKIYTRATEAIEDGYKALVEFEKELDTAIEICIDDGSKPSEDFLRNISSNLLPNYIFQMAQFRDGLKAYEDDGIISSFNKDFDSFIIPYFKDTEDDD